MISIELIGHDNKYQVDEIIDLFIENREMVNYKVVSKLKITEDIIASVQIYEEQSLMSEKIVVEKLENNISKLELTKLSKRLIKISLFRALKKLINKDIHWGILTGIRPTKVVRDMKSKGLTFNQIVYDLINKYEIDEKKANLLIDVAVREQKVLDNTNENNVSLYIGIPFCPTRCLYCSFTSTSMEKYGHLMEPYIEALIKEIRSVKDIIVKNKWIVQTIYFGGGTPTSLSEHQLDRLLFETNSNFDFNNVKEITVEAGRPDTITKEKLRIIKKYGIHRISINPQTMNNKTLVKIGRNHTADQIINSYYLARDLGFDNINMDIILGLPGEEKEHVIYTLEELRKLDPDSITVHTMSIKRASKLKEDIEKHDLTHSITIGDMIDISTKYMKEMNLNPYYLYRQKDILGNFENVGYSKTGFECIYNIQIIEEKQTIIAIGAGGVSKIVYPKEDRIERIFNVKDVEHYINRIDEMIARKDMLYMG